MLTFPARMLIVNMHKKWVSRATKILSNKSALRVACCSFLCARNMVGEIFAWPGSPNGSCFWLLSRDPFEILTRNRRWGQSWSKWVLELTFAESENERFHLPSVQLPAFEHSYFCTPLNHTSHQTLSSTPQMCPFLLLCSITTVTTVATSTYLQCLSALSAPAWSLSLSSFCSPIPLTLLPWCNGS